MDHTNFEPVTVRAEGNCLPATISYFIFGHEKYQVEARVRIAMELVSHEISYLDDGFLARGLERQGHSISRSVYYVC